MLRVRTPIRPNVCRLVAGVAGPEGGNVRPWSLFPFLILILILIFILHYARQLQHPCNRKVETGGPSPLQLIALICTGLQQIAPNCGIEGGEGVVAVPPVIWAIQGYSRLFEPKKLCSSKRLPRRSAQSGQIKADQTKSNHAAFSVSLFRLQGGAVGLCFHCLNAVCADVH